MTDAGLSLVEKGTPHRCRQALAVGAADIYVRGAAYTPHRFDCGLRFRNAAFAPLRLGCGVRPGRRDAAFAEPQAKADAVGGALGLQVASHGHTKSLQRWFDQLQFLVRRDSILLNLLEKIGVSCDSVSELLRRARPAFSPALTAACRPGEKLIWERKMASWSGLTSGGPA